VEGKIINERPELARVLSAHRQRGERIVFTNGCFDLLHLGHIKLLHEAKSIGEVLVVGLNTDASVKRLKGSSRPCLEEDERAHILASLDCVDYVTLFDEDNPLNLIELLKPDILVKGADYAKEKVVGWDIVEAYGGQVRLVNLVENQSTSCLIKNIIDRHRD
jgi:D-beta-D-heptose 7-phosphate kinase/D-beta-D-heptose 1-phosphate adenosyltransferase